MTDFFNHNTHYVVTTRNPCLTWAKKWTSLI